jgi:hypothetical protein
MTTILDIATPCTVQNGACTGRELLHSRERMRG